MWNHWRNPWFILSGGDDGGIYKSTDRDDTWNKLEGGLPKLVAEIGVDVSASNPNRLYAIIEAEPEKGGLYRSDDAGNTWKRVNPHRVLHTRAWYYNHITADPVNQDTVWVLNAPLMKSIDGGKNWEKIVTPHGDHHDHWINPRDNRIMINGNDGGATVTFDGGKTWSSIIASGPSKISNDESHDDLTSSTTRQPHDPRPPFESHILGTYLMLPD